MVRVTPFTSPHDRVRVPTSCQEKLRIGVKVRGERLRTLDLLVNVEVERFR